jgi:hypothetical protein
MLKIIEIGKFECDHCKDGKKKKGVELQSYGFATKGEMEKPSNEGTPTTARKRVRKVEIRRYVWREQLHLCLKHFHAHLSEMIDGLDSPLNLWGIHKEAAMRTDYVNITYEEAQKRGLLRREK